jgi:hypothetical protein
MLLIKRLNIRRFLRGLSRNPFTAASGNRRHFKARNIASLARGGMSGRTE